MAWGNISAGVEIAIIAAVGMAVIEGACWLSNEWAKFLVGPPRPPMPDYDGPCRCTACRIRPHEPCSDADGA